MKFQCVSISAVFFEPTDRRKASKILQNNHIIQYASPNLSELREMANFIHPVQHTGSASRCDVTEISQLSKKVSRFIKNLIVTIGSKGVVTIQNAEYAIKDINNESSIEDKLTIKVYQTDPLEKIENVSGAGDCFSSGVIHGILSGLQESQCISLGFGAAKMTLLSKKTVSSDLNSINFIPLGKACFKYFK